MTSITTARLRGTRTSCVGPAIAVVSSASDATSSAAGKWRQRRRAGLATDCSSSEIGEPQHPSAPGSQHHRIDRRHRGNRDEEKQEPARWRIPTPTVCPAAVLVIACPSDRAVGDRSPTTEPTSRRNPLKRCRVGQSTASAWTFSSAENNRISTTMNGTPSTSPTIQRDARADRLIDAQAGSPVPADVCVVVDRDQRSEPQHDAEQAVADRLDDADDERDQLRVAARHRIGLQPRVEVAEAHQYQDHPGRRRHLAVRQCRDVPGRQVQQPRRAQHRHRCRSSGARRTAPPASPTSRPAGLRPADPSAPRNTVTGRLIARKNRNDEQQLATPAARGPRTTHGRRRQSCSSSPRSTAPRLTRSTTRVQA